VQGSLKNVDLELKSLTFKGCGSGSGESFLTYDYLVLATGLQRPWPIVPTADNHDQYVKDAEAHIAGIENAREKSVVVIGGGECHICVEHAVITITERR